ncbi:MAG TPA: aldo/keto reductase [Ilumatobacteraceae bacterium]
MQHVRFGRTGLKVSRLCLGTMTFGFQCDEATSFAIMDAASEAGITFFDTADVYPLGAPFEVFGRTEELIGQWVADRRDRFIIATKCYFPTGPNPWDSGNSRKNIMRALDASLRRLQTDYVDLYQIHGIDPVTPIEETVVALDDVVRSGKVRYVGCSNFLAYQLARSIGRAEVLRTVRFESVQPRYNLLFRENERELLPFCLDENIAVIPYNPLAGGFLSGKHQRGAPTEGSRFTLGFAAGRYQERYWNDRMFKTIDELRPIADASGVSMATMAVQWVLANPAITSPIIGASRPEQLKDSVAALDAPMDPTVKQQLDGLTYEFRFGDNAR